MTIIKSALPSASILRKEGNSYDYVDSFLCQFKDKGQNIGTPELAKAFFKNKSKWISFLFALRNKIVGLFGLKTSGDFTDKQKLLDNFQCEPGQRLGLFKVFSKTDNEIVLGEDDKHLDFRVSVFLDQPVNIVDHKTLTISTTVIFNNWLGRIYFMVVKPFHVLIVPRIIKGIIRELK